MWNKESVILVGLWMFALVVSMIGVTKIHEPSGGIIYAIGMTVFAVVIVHCIFYERILKALRERQ